MGRIGGEGGNDAMTLGRDIPWLQDVEGQDAWARWKVVLDDLVLLDADNRFTEVYNLYDFDLSDAANRDALKSRLRELSGM